MIRYVVGGPAKQRGAAPTSQVGRFETEVSTRHANLDVLMDMSGMWIDRVRRAKPMHEIVLDMDSSASETYGVQEGSAYNSADDRRSVLEPVVARYRHGS